MKVYRLYLFFLIIALGCGTSTSNSESYGALITEKGAISTADFLKSVSAEEAKYKVKGEIEEICQMKGCWVTLAHEGSETIRVTFKDYGFFVPKDRMGKEIILEGLAKKKVLEEAVAEHYADDAGKPYDASMREVISFVAEGVLIAKD